MAVLSIGQVWAATTITLTESDVRSNTSYNTTEKTFTNSDVDFGYINVMTNNANGTPTDWAKNQVMQSKNSSYLYNKDELSTIQHVKVYIVVNDNALSVGYGTTEKPTETKIAKADATSGSESITYTKYANKTTTPNQTTTATTYDFDLSSYNATYFTIIPGGSTYIWKVEVTYESSGSEKTDVTDEQLHWSAATDEVTIGAQGHTYPTLTNSLTLPVTYESSTPAVATIDESGEITLVKAGQTTIRAKFAGNDDLNAKTVSYTLTVNAAPLTTMDAIFAAATDAGSTAKDVTINFDNWVVSGANGSTAYVTDGTKGFIVYYSGHGFAEGDILSGTGSFKLKLYNGAAEVTAKNSGTITITKGGTAPLNVLDADGISALSGINTGSLIKINGTCSVSSGKYYINNSTNTVQVYTTLYSFTSNPPEATKEYNCTGVYVQYNTTKEIMPRKEADIVEIVPAGAPEFNPTSKKFVGSINVTLSQEQSLPIYYTDDEDLKATPSTTTWTPYTGAITVTATKTIWAAALDGSDWSDVNEATYTLATPLTTMEAIQGATTSSTAQPFDITITNWVVTAVSESRVWMVEPTNEKGILLYNTGSHGFVADKKLNGTVFDTKLKAFDGFVELTTLFASDVTVSDLEPAEAITARTTTIADLATGRPAEQGTIVKLANVTYNGTAFTDGENTISIDTRLYAPTLESGKKYNLTGVVFYSSATAIKLMPRSEDDVEELASQELTSITLSGAYPTAFETGDEFSHEGMVVTAHYDGAADAVVTALAEYSGYNMSVADDYTVTVSYTENEITKTAEYSITVSDPAPTGDFELLEGELVAGDYLIYEGGSLMKAEIESNRFYYEEATPDANGIISNPSQYAVWTLAKSGDYWTFYNAKAGKYAAGTGGANKAQLLADGTDDKSLWSINGDLVVTNKANAAAEVNATLRHNFSGNTNYGFACYSATQGGKPVFYKRATPSYYISETLTGCTADANNPTKVPQTLTEDVELKYNLTTGYVWPDAITVEVGGVALAPNELDYLWDNTQTPAELTIAKEKVNGNIVVTITAIEKELDNITIAQAPNKVDYETGEFFNPSGLQISLNYTAGASDVVVYNDDTKDAFTFSPDLETALATTDVQVEISYAGKSVNQAITVTDPVPSSSVVAIIAKMGDDYYAMSTTYNNNAFTAIAVTKDGDDYNVPTDEVKASILWTMSTLSTKAKFQGTDDNYLAKGNGNTDLVYSEDEVEWTWSADGYYYYSSGRTFISNGSVFKNYATSNINASGYSDAPEFIAEANIKVVPVEAHEFVVTPDAPVAFGTVEVDETVSPKSFDVTLTGITSATVTLEGDAVFSIDKSTLTADGTITVTPNTENAGNFSATITLSDDDNLADDKVINVTMKVVEPKDCDGEDDFNTVSDASGYDSRTSTTGWSAVNTAVSTVNEVTYWIMQGNTSSVGVITSPELNNGIGKLTLDYMYPFSEANGVSFKVEIKQNGALVEGKSYTITNADAVQSTVYTETIENINVEGNFQIVITNLSPSGATKSKDRFGVGNFCWKNYSAPAPDYGIYHRDVTSGNYGTICLPKAGTIEGATLFNIVDKSTDMIYIEEVGSDAMEAGKPYIFQATADQLNVTYTSNVEEEAGIANGLYGSYTQELLTPNDGNYILHNNQYWLVDGTAYVGENRAYIKIGMINYTVPAPGRRRIGMVVNGEQVVTGIDELNASETPVKMIIDGQLYILRGEKMYNANGQIVK